MKSKHKNKAMKLDETLDEEQTSKVSNERS